MTNFYTIIVKNLSEKEADALCDYSDTVLFTGKIAKKIKQRKLHERQKYDNCVETNRKYADKTLCIVEGVEQISCTSCLYNLPLEVFRKYQSHNL